MREDECAERGILRPTHKYARVSVEERMGERRTPYPQPRRAYERKAAKPPKNFFLEIKLEKKERC